MATYTDMLKNIYEYELVNGVSEDDRHVVYIPAIGIYKPVNMSNEEVKKIYASISLEVKHTETEAIEESNMDEDEIDNDNIIEVTSLSLQDSKIIVAKKFSKEKMDIATFACKNIKNAVTSYLSIRTNKAIGYKVNDNMFFLMEKQKNDEFSVYMNDVVLEEDFYYNYYKESLCELVTSMEQERARQIADEKAAKEREKELCINPSFLKEFNKQLKKQKNICIKGENFKAFDFRTINLCDIVFVDCDFSYANFTDLNICDTIFIRCTMIDLIEDGTKYENVEKLKCKYISE